MTEQTDDVQVGLTVYLPFSCLKVVAEKADYYSLTVEEYSRRRILSCRLPIGKVEVIASVGAILQETNLRLERIENRLDHSPPVSLQKQVHELKGIMKKLGNFLSLENAAYLRLKEMQKMQESISK
ncbi:MAG TPA: hypothetical protein IGS53_28125 [Leptolyngbyaceae cyanobacterium M33_DOE_097]|uniref:Uncharacterized protein n=1 Tax=Oscillatoriales cyanobacterium SpSt-418 TaxID=2282169 RepID=A0A7C3KFS3_9CYAN|nr:hypothetical protein [Leptolyngbyaceae cyanobacterium M33_DOE_097]